jgi:transposase InsO family protein
VPGQRYAAAEKQRILDTVREAMERSGRPLHWVLEHLGVAPATYYRWVERARRDHLADRVVVPPPLRKPLPEEEEAVKAFALAHPREGYRRLAWMMVDADVAYLGPSSVYMVLRRNDLLARWKRSEPVEGGRRPAKPTRPDQVWHTDLMYLRVGVNWYFLMSVLDGYSRYVVHHELLLTMEAWRVTDVMTRALDTLDPFPETPPRLVRDNGSQFVAEGWRDMVAHFGLKEIPIRKGHPESNGLQERFHRTTREEGLSDEYLLHYYHAVDLLAEWVRQYNTVRLHSALDYLRPIDYYRGDPKALIAERRDKLQQASQHRQSAWRERLHSVL